MSRHYFIKSCDYYNIIFASDTVEEDSTEEKHKQFKEGKSKKKKIEIVCI